MFNNNKFNQTLRQSGWQITTILPQNLYIQLSLGRSHSQGKILQVKTIIKGLR